MIERERQAEENRSRQEENAQRYTLEALMEQYVAKLVLAGKSSVSQVRNAIRRHIILTHPEIANKAANEITRGQLTEILRMIVNQGHGRTAARVRSYMRAAYALALGAESDPTASRDLVNFQITSNPVTDIPAMSQYSMARERALSPIELAEFWRSIRAIDSEISRVIQTSILLGGQRITQLLRAELTDYQVDRIILLDPKGRRHQPRTHILPVTPMAAEVLDICKQNAESLSSRFLFTTHGTRSIALNSVSHWVNDWVKAQSVVAPFSLGDIRRTCETLLASRGVSSDIRAQIQSHGLGGIQARHYDRYEYMDEKRRALTDWNQWIQSISTDPGEQ
jgi:integrase